ncbi:Uma2 family endonuclease [Planctomycetota bacterium]
MSTADSGTKFGYREYCGLPEDGNRHEIIGGDHVMNPAPNTYHQRISVNLCFQLYAKVQQPGLGIVFSAPTDVQLGEYDIVQPDLLVVMNSQRNIVTPTKVKGAPDLIVEIISPSTEQADRTRKKDLYCRSGVSEYWIVVPDDHQLEQWVLDENAFRQIETDGTSVKAQFLDGVEIDLTKVW